MPKTARISTVRVSSASENSDSAQFISIALFSGIGLLVSLVAVLAGVQGVWFKSSSIFRYTTSARRCHKATADSVHFRLGRVEIFGGLQGAGYRFFAMLGAD